MGEDKMYEGLAIVPSMPPFCPLDQISYHNWGPALDILFL